MEIVYIAVSWIVLEIYVYFRVRKWKRLSGDLAKRCNLYEKELHRCYGAQFSEFVDIVSQAKPDSKITLELTLYPDEKINI